MTQLGCGEKVIHQKSVTVKESANQKSNEKTKKKVY